MPPRRSRRQRPLPKLITLIGLSVLLHAVLLASLHPIWDQLTYIEPRGGKTMPVTLLIEQPELPPVEEIEEEEPEFKGQIVDLAPPEEEITPEEADYLAAQDQAVEEESRTEQYRVNPDVLADSYTRDDQLQFEDVVDMNITDPSTGAQVGNDRFDPSEDGRLSALPSPFALSNKDGLQKPVPSSSTEARRAGAPNNDLLNEQVSDRTRLNAKEYLFHGYMMRIRRLVNFYWNQNIQNMPRSEPLTKPSYTTVLDVVLDSNGALESIEVIQDSGSDVVDNCIIDAFRIAGPFPNPPEQLISKDGRVYLPQFSFELTLGHAQAPFIGVDPRQDVRFPGILKTNR
ncbi:MAG: TonB C-terminal domain-containing protein [Myxococcota bacterium]|nr:TonB C-terminal domain-containing protein [Myxococcota bacterium]